MPNVHFLIVGAQKAGTTSLFEYVRRHPGIYMPPEKEVAFFAIDHLYQRGLDWFEARVTRNAPPGAVCGSASVGDMTGTPFRDISLDAWRPTRTAEAEQIEDVIPQRIHHALPDARLLCVLRDPVQRALSHYRMAVLDGLESEPFDAAITRLMEPRAIEHARAVATGHNGYVARGEYGRILAGFLRVFSREQMMIVFSSDLARNTRNVLSSVFAFVGVDPDFMPDNTEKRYRSAGVRQRIPGLNVNQYQARLAQVGPARRLWHALPPRARSVTGRSVSVAAYRVELWNARRERLGEEMSASTAHMLRSHFEPDGEALSELLGLEVPWLTAWRQPAA